MRMLIEQDSCTETFCGQGWSRRGIWPCRWISCSDATQPPFVTAYRRCFTLETDARIRAHVSADERYELFVDGRRVGRGSERGDKDNWFFETYELSLEAGQHVIVARVWSLGEQSPFAQMSVYPGFMFATEEPFIDLLGTGVATWQAKKFDGYEFTDSYPTWGTGAKLVVDGARFPWGFHLGKGDGWQDAVVRHEGSSPSVVRHDIPYVRLMKPATLPAMLEESRNAGNVRFIANVASDQTRTIPLKSSENLTSEIEPWNRMLAAPSGNSGITIPSRTRRRVLVDLEDYYCAYPELTVSRGKDSLIRVYWAEALYENPDVGKQNDCGYSKGSRDEIEDKFFFGAGDTFKPDGGPSRTFDTLWWRAGRYLEIVIQTALEPLVVENIKFRETRYPLDMESSFDTDDSRLRSVTPLALRGLQMCAHETYIDCPYYEQLMYVGDSRLEALVTYALTHDHRLPRKSLRMFDASRRPNGLTQSRYPSRIMQIIPPFSLWWVAMVYDYALWQDDRATVKSLMVGVRHVIDGCLAFLNHDGLIGAPPGWNFVDWVPSWDKTGVPPEGTLGVSAILNWQMVMVLLMNAELEDYFQEPELAQRLRRLAGELSSRIGEAFWDSSHNLFADDLAKQHFSEHTQCLAVLSRQIEPAQLEAITGSLLADQSLCRTTVYFTHYLFETYRLLGRMDAFFDRLGAWFEYEKVGLKTTPEMPEPTRSDCHGWGAHILYHYFASILGIRPGSMGFKTVTIEPQLGPLTYARGKLVHPNGFVEVDFCQKDGHLTGGVRLPSGVGGTIVCDNQKRSLAEGESCSI